MKDRRRTILEAAARVIARRGVRGLRVEELAVEAGVSKALVYYHFEDRAGLLRSTLEFIGARAERYTRRDPPTPQGPGAAVRDPGPAARGPGPVVPAAGSAAHDPGTATHDPGSGSARREFGSAPHGPGPAPHDRGPAPHDRGPAPHAPGSALGDLERRLLLELQDVPEIRENSTAWGELRVEARSSSPSCGRTWRAWVSHGSARSRTFWGRAPRRSPTKSSWRLRSGSPLFWRA